MGVIQSIRAATQRIQAEAVEVDAAIRALIAQCQEIERQRRRKEEGAFWATGEVFCRVGGVLSQANPQSLGNRGEVSYNGETHVFVGYDPSGRPRIERRRDPGPGRGRNRREVVPFRRPNNDHSVGSLGIALCRQGEDLKRRGRKPDGR